MKAYLFNIAGAFSQLANAFLGGYRDNSLSVRTKYYLDQGVPSPFVIGLAWLIDRLLGKGHVDSQKEGYIKDKELIPLDDALFALSLSFVFFLFLLFLLLF